MQNATEEIEDVFQVPPRIDQTFELRINRDPVHDVKTASHQTSIGNSARIGGRILSA